MLIDENRITFALGPRCRALCVAATLLAAAALIAGCGGGGGTSPSAAEKDDDIAILNTALGYEMVAADAYRLGFPLLRGEALATARLFRSQEQEHIDAITKAIRGLGGEADPEPIAVTQIAPADADAAHRIAYERVSGAIAEQMAAINKLNSPWPRTLLATIAANEGQQLAVLRRELGAAPVPEAFENGETPPPR